jgi:hypothetical protein
MSSTGHFFALSGMAVALIALGSVMLSRQIARVLTTEKRGRA